MVRSPSRLFESELQKTRILATFEQHIAGRAVAGRDGITPDVFREHFGDHLNVIHSKLRDGSYRFSSYKQHLISKGAGRAPRVVSIATVRDRLLLKAATNVLAAVFPGARTPLAPELVSALIESLGLGTHTAYVRLDVKDFYPSVRHEEVLSGLRTEIRSGRLLRVLLGAVRTPTLAASAPPANTRPCVGVPQGLPVSNILAEIAMLGVDKDLSAIPGVRYFRYVDDVLILCATGDETRVADLAIARLAARGLTAHEIGTASKSEIGLLANPFSYLGYQFEWPRVTVRSASIANLKNSLVKPFTQYFRYVGRKKDPKSKARALKRLQLRLDLKITGCRYDKSRRGWISFYSQIRHQQLLRHLDWYVEQLVGRFDVPLEPKSFVDAYRFAARKQVDATGFVPNFDDLNTEQAIQVLDEYFLMDSEELRKMSEVRVAEIFKRKMHRMVVELERDVSPTS